MSQGLLKDVLLERYSLERELLQAEIVELLNQPESFKQTTNKLDSLLTQYINATQKREVIITFYEE